MIAGVEIHLRAKFVEKRRVGILGATRVHMGHCTKNKKQKKHIEKNEGKKKAEAVYAHRSNRSNRPNLCNSV